MSGLRVVVAGRMAGVSGQGGASWAVLQYVLGLRRLGHDVLFVEPLEREPEVVERGARPPGVRPYFDRIRARFGLAETAALLLPGSRETIGVPRRRVMRFCRDADLLLNLSGVLRDPELLSAVSLRAYVDLDPGFTQLWSDVEGIDMGFDGHDRFVTVGLSVGGKDCPVPTCGLRWIPTVQPVALDEWPPARRTRYPAFTTVANWRGYGSVEHGGVKYGQKAHAVRRLLSLPSRTDASLLLALAIDAGEGAEPARLREAGWRLVDPLRVAGTPERYRAFVRGSMAELGIAKTGYTLSRSGWFSDRSACYLASGRPVLAEETGFGRHLPTGEGLLSFSGAEEALAGIDEIRGGYERHGRAARELAEEHFDSDRVLERLLDLVGASAPPSGVGDAPSGAGEASWEVGEASLEVGEASPALRDAPPGAAGELGSESDLPMPEEEWEELRGVVESGLADRGWTRPRVTRLERRPSPYGTSFALDELDVLLDDGTRLELLRKNVSPHAMAGEARRAKPRFLVSPSREIQAYRQLLSPREIGPRFYGSVDEPERGRHWLLLERVRGVELYQVGDRSVWRAVARWLARFHAAFHDEPRLDGVAERAGLLRFDEELLATWMDRALAFTASSPGVGPGERRILQGIHDRKTELVASILSLPRTLIHGEFYASNILVRPRPGQTADVRPVDWEMVGVGPGLLDLAALVSGSWTEEEKREIALAYREELEESGALAGDAAAFGDTEVFLDALARCRLQIAVQWLGWAPDWRPPTEHATDWLAEVVMLAGVAGR